MGPGESLRIESLRIESLMHRPGRETSGRSGDPRPSLGGHDRLFRGLELSGELLLSCTDSRSLCSANSVGQAWVLYTDGSSHGGLLVEALTAFPLFTEDAILRDDREGLMEVLLGGGGHQPF